MKYRYAPLYRPPSTCTLPCPFTLVERPAPGLGFDRRTDLPASIHRFGVVQYDRPLSDDDLARYELKLV
jgi:hypothetical protein